MSEEELFAEIEQLKEDFDTKVDSILSEAKNLKAEALDVQEEKMKLQHRQSQLEARAERLKRLAAYMLHGEKWKNGKHAVSYRRSEEVVIDDQFLEWAEVCAPRLVKATLSPVKGEISKAIEGGAVFEHAHIEQKNNIIIK